MEAKHIEEYLGYLTHEKQLSQRTITEYHRDLSKFVYWCAENRVLPLEAEPNDARRYIRSLAAAGRAKTSLARSISALKSFYRWAMTDGYAKQDAAYYLIAPRKPERLPVYLTEGECAMLLSTVAEGENVTALQRRVSIKLLYYCGLRAREFTSMLTTQVERDGVGTPIRLKVIGKRNKERTLPIPEPMQKDLRLWIEHRQNLREWNYARNYKRTAEYINSRYLFPSPIGEELNYKAVEKCVKTACRKAGIEKPLTPHGLRHTYATNLIRRGVPLLTVSEALGHANIATTQIYTHIERKEMETQIHGTHVKPL